jgi:hypothetical protein
LGGEAGLIYGGEVVLAASVLTLGRIAEGSRKLMGEGLFGEAKWEGPVAGYKRRCSY